MTPSDREGLRALAEKATPGPWRPEQDTELVWGACDPDDTTTYGMGVPLANCIKETPRWARDVPRFHLDYDQGVINAAFIAAANPTTVRALLDENERMRAALGWYGEQARLARLIHSEGDAGRHALSDDGGKRARAALSPTQPEEVK